mgnify:CR=1 FL=1
MHSCSSRRWAQYSELPLWVPERYHAFGDVAISRAIESGLSYRPLEETLSDTFDWARAQPRERRSLRFGSLAIPNALSRERERALLDLWRDRAAG